MFADLAAAVTAAADCVTRSSSDGATPNTPSAGVASATTLWRLVVLTCRGSGRRAPTPANTAGPPVLPRPRDSWLHLDVDASITVDDSDDKEEPRATWKMTFAFHPLLVF